MKQPTWKFSPGASPSLSSALQLLIKQVQSCLQTGAQVAHGLPQVCCREWPQGGSPGHGEELRGTGKAQREQGLCWGSALQQILWGYGGRWMTWGPGGRWVTWGPAWCCRQGTSWGASAGSVLSPWHCEVVTPSGAAGDSVTAIPWCPNGRQQGTGSISQGLALLWWCHSATTTWGATSTCTCSHTLSHRVISHCMRRGLVVLAGGFLLAVLKTAIGLSRISNPWPSPQLSFSGLPQKLTA